MRDESLLFPGTVIYYQQQLGLLLQRYHAPALVFLGSQILMQLCVFLSLGFPFLVSIELSEVAGEKGLVFLLFSFVDFWFCKLLSIINSDGVTSAFGKESFWDVKKADALDCFFELQRIKAIIRPKPPRAKNLNDFWLCPLLQPPKILTFYKLKRV